MSPLPRFHTKANEEAQARVENRKEERDKANAFLEELDELLTEDA